MKLLRTENDRFVFELGRREKTLFQDVLRHYPLSPVSHHKLTHGTLHTNAANQELLEEAMASLRQQQQGRVGELLRAEGRFAAQGSGWRITFSREEMEWLLQVLNDVRVGSWLILGCPDPDEGTVPDLNESNAKYLFLMELSGQFEGELLEALDGPG